MKNKKIVYIVVTLINTDCDHDMISEVVFTTMDEKLADDVTNALKNSNQNKLKKYNINLKFLVDYDDATYFGRILQ